MLKMEIFVDVCVPTDIQLEQVEITPFDSCLHWCLEKLIISNTALRWLWLKLSAIDTCTFDLIPAVNCCFSILRAMHGGVADDRVIILQKRVYTRFFILFFTHVYTVETFEDIILLIWTCLPPLHFFLGNNACNHGVAPENSALLLNLVHEYTLTIIPTQWLRISSFPRITMQLPTIVSLIICWDYAEPQLQIYHIRHTHDLVKSA